MTIAIGGHHGLHHPQLDNDRRRTMRRCLDLMAYGALYPKPVAPDHPVGGKQQRKETGWRVVRRYDPRTDERAGLEDFVRRINRIGFPRYHTLKYPLWTVEDVKWAATLTEKLYRDLEQFAYGRHDLDPLERVLRARMAVTGVAHAMSYRTSKKKADAIVRGLPKNTE